MDLIDAAISCEKPAGRFAYVAPYLNQAKDVAWGYLKQFTAPVENVEANESDLWVKFPHNGARVRIYGADNYERIRGIYLDGVILDEYADMDPRAWTQVIRPALSDRAGWATFIGTPKGPNAFYDLWQTAQRSPEWFTMLLKASETGILGAEELTDLKASMTPDEYKQEFECSFDAAVKGAYYAQEIEDMRSEGRICRVPVDKYAEVHTSWDLGMRDQTAIWFVQRVGQEVRLVDYYEASGVGLDHYAQRLRDWQSAHGTRYGTHYLPHDVKVQELGTGRSRFATLDALGVDGIDVVPLHAVLDGVNSVRRMLPRTWIDEEKCARGLRCLQMARSDIDEKTGAWKSRPVHDEFLHGADALRYFAAVYDDRAAKSGAREPRYKFKSNTRSTSWMTA
jgi:phage terminase large subunit